MRKLSGERRAYGEIIENNFFTVAELQIEFTVSSDESHELVPTNLR